MGKKAISKTKKNKKKELDSKTILLRWVSKLILLILILMCVFLVYYVVSIKVYKNTGYKFRPIISIHAIVSQSMSPNYNVDDVVVDYLVKDPKKIKVGDVITFLPENYNDNSATITHRVVQVVEKNGVYFYKTKGDNNNNNDTSLVSFENVLGKVIVKIPYVGKMQLLLKKQELFNSCFYFLIY